MTAGVHDWSRLFPSITGLLCAMFCLVVSTGAAADVIYRCVRSDGEIVVSFNRKLDGMKCTVYEDLDRAQEKPKGARCHSQRFRDTIFYKCEKDGVWYIFNKPVAPAVKTGVAGGVRQDGARQVASSADVLLPAIPAGASRVADLPSIVASASAEFGVPVALLMAVIEVESGFNPDIVSPVGAQGLMQLMPVTADYLDVDNPFDPAQNVRAGAKLIRILSDRFEGDIELVLAAYYAGASTVERAGGVPASCEDYVAKVMDRYRRHLGAVQ